MTTKGGLCVFLHIPKTGGATLLDIIQRHYKQKNHLGIKGVGTSFHSKAIEKAKDATPFLISGHLGLKEVLDIPGSFLFTFLRPPVARVISHYYFLKETPEGKYFDYLQRPETTIESFYARKEKRDFDNCLVRFVSGNHPEFGKIGEADYLTALENLQTKIHFFGMQEFYDESLIMLSSKLGWSLPVYRKKNLTKKKENVSPETIAFLKEANHWDILLYEKAKELFNERLQQMSPEEKRKLKRLRFFNKIAGLFSF